MKTKPKSNGIDELIHRVTEKKPKALGITAVNVLKARKAAKLGANIAEIAKALKVSYPTAWKAVKGVKPYDKVA